jgi:hypothetical protein
MLTDLVMLTGVVCKWTRDLRGSVMVTDLAMLTVVGCKWTSNL